MYKKLLPAMFLVFYLALTAAPVKSQQPGNCDPGLYLQHSNLMIYDPGSNAQVSITNLSEQCQTTVGLAAYEVNISGKIDTFSVMTATVTAGSTVDFDVPVPDCKSQVLAFWGNYLVDINENSYAEREIQSTTTDDRMPCVNCDEPESYLAHSPLMVYQPGTNCQISITNLSESCNADVGLASYKLMEENQLEIYGSNTKNLPPGVTVDMDVRIPNCRGQIWAFFGPPEEDASEESYVGRTVDMTETLERPPCYVPPKYLVYFPMVSK